MARRPVVNGAIAVGGVILLAGCLGLLTGSEPLSFAATEATVSDEARSLTGYELRERRTVPFNRTVTVQGQKRGVRMTNRVAVYDKTVRGMPVGVAVVVATPRAAAFGQPLNPFGRVGERELLDRTLSRAGADLSGVRRSGSRTLTVLGTETRAVRFTATARRGGRAVEVIAYVVRVSDGDDFVIAEVLFPARVSNGDAEAVTLLSGIEH